MKRSTKSLPSNRYNALAWIVGNPQIGENVWIGAFCLIDGSYNTLKIGRGTNVSSGAQIITHSTVKRCLSEHAYPKIESKPTEIGEFCFIGTNAVILMGSQIGDHSVVAAGAVVTENTVVPPYSIVAGVPARVIGNSKKFLKDIENQSICIVMFMRNQEVHVEALLSQALDDVKHLTKDYEVVVINNSSTDSTGKILDKIVLKNKQLRIIHCLEKKDFSKILSLCYSSIKKQLVFFIPSPESFKFSKMKNFTEAIRGYDIVVEKKGDGKNSLFKKSQKKPAVVLWRRYILDTTLSKSHNASLLPMEKLIHIAVTQGYKLTTVSS